MRLTHESIIKRKILTNKYFPSCMDLKGKSECLVRIGMLYEERIDPGATSIFCPNDSLYKACVGLRRIDAIKKYREEMGMSNK